jgi:hypothetical protein
VFRYLILHMPEQFPVVNPPKFDYNEGSCGMMNMSSLAALVHNGINCMVESQ